MSQTKVFRIQLLSDKPAKAPYILKADDQPKDVKTLYGDNATSPSPISRKGGIFRNAFDYFFDEILKSDHLTLEFAYEYGLLRLSDSMRRKLGIQTLVVEIETSNKRCFRNRYWRFVLREFIGYQEMLLANVRNAFGRSSKGYVRNVATGETFRFVSTWVTKLSFLAGFTVMIIFTLSISLLLRYCHNQIFFFIVELLQVLEVNVIVVGSPIASFITAILAMIGIETIMSEFFNDSSIAFLIIVLVWVADQFYAVCCRTPTSLKYWPRFFYVYQFAFYAYFVRYNGLFSGLALFCTYCFVAHSMIYCLNHFELPAMIVHTHEMGTSSTANRS